MKQVLQNLKTGELEVADVPGLKNIIRLIMTIGIFWTVDSCSAKSPEPAEGLHCATIKLGQAGDFEKVGEGLLANPKVWGPAGKDGAIAYRRLKPNSTAEVLFAAFDVDDEGFCKNDMILEIFYRDDIKQRLVSKGKVRGRVVINSRVDFSKDNEYVEAGNLRSTGDGQWKLARIFFERTPRQMVRAIDSSFHFRIIMTASGSKELPISYIRLISINHNKFVELREQERFERGLKRLDHKPSAKLVSPPEKWKKLGFVACPVNCLELVFPNSTVDYNRAGGELRCFEVPGQAEPVSFVIHAFEDLSNVQVKVSDLRSGTNLIPSENIQISKVAYNDQRWGWGRETKYGKCPDYLMPVGQNVNIKRGMTQQFWLTIDVPEQAKPGLYKGNVSILIEHRETYSIPLYVDVLAVKLFRSQVKHMVYHSPYFRAFHRQPTAVLQDMKSHGLIPIFYPRDQLTATLNGGLSVRLNDFEYKLQIFREIYPSVDTIFVGLFDYDIVWKELAGPEPRYQREFPEFELVYGRLLRKYAYLAKKYSLEVVFSFADEPNFDLNRRRLSYLCSKIAQQNGFKTWCAYAVYADVQLSLTPQEQMEKINYLRPLSEVLDIFICGSIHIDDIAIRKIKKSGASLGYYTTYVGTSVRPVYNRFLHGLYPVVIGSNYVVSYAYRDGLVDPYDDLDYRKQEKETTGSNDYLLTYPTWKGEILPTLSYEALREGVEDSHLISTMQIMSHRALRASDPNVVRLGKEAEEYLDGILKRVSKNFKRRYREKHKDLPVDPMEKAILRDLNNGESEDYEIFDRIRRGVCDRIIALQDALGR